MVIIFAHPKVRQYLLEHLLVYTMRTHTHKEGKDWATDKRGGKKIADVVITEIKDPSSAMDYVALSGFSNILEWEEAFLELNPIHKKWDGLHLYKVEIISPFCIQRKEIKKEKT